MPETTTSIVIKVVITEEVFNITIVKAIIELVYCCSGPSFTFINFLASISIIHYHLVNFNFKNWISVSVINEGTRKQHYFAAIMLSFYPHVFDLLVTNYQVLQEVYFSILFFTP